jgi:hypothetical protein
VGSRVRKSDDPGYECWYSSKERLLAMLAGEHASGRDETTRAMKQVLHLSKTRREGCRLEQREKMQPVPGV